MAGKKQTTKLFVLMRQKLEAASHKGSLRGLKRPLYASLYIQPGMSEVFMEKQALQLIHPRVSVKIVEVY